MSTDIATQTEQIVETLESHRDTLETLASTDSPFAARAEAALDWLDEHSEEVENGE